LLKETACIKLSIENCPTESCIVLITFLAKFHSVRHTELFSVSITLGRSWDNSGWWSLHPLRYINPFL